MNDGVTRAPLKCKAKRSDGQPCMAWRIKGAEVCRVHGGRAPQVKAAAKRRLALGEAEKELTRLGVPIEVDPAEAMLQMVWEAAGNVAVLRRMVTDLRHEVGEGQGEEIFAGSAIAGRIDPANWKAAPHVLVTMYNEERERLVKWAKACRDAGVEESRVRLAERQGEMLVTVLRTLLASLAGALVSAGLAEAVVRAVIREQAPSLFRQAVSVASGET